MTSKRLHLVLLIALAALFVGLVGGAYGVNKLLVMQADRLTAVKAKSLALDQGQVSLQKAKKDIITYSDLEKITRTVVPEDKNQAEAVREIVNIAAANGITLASITFPASTLGNTAAVSPTAAKPATIVTPSANTKATALSQLLAVPNIPGVYQLIITVQSDSNHPVAYNKFIGFLSALEQNRRTAQVSTITITPDKVNHNLLTFNLTINGYIKP